MNDDLLDGDPFHCPTCGARQSPAVECRRCKCDLRLVVAVHTQARTLHEQCLRHLRDGAHQAALTCALRRQELVADDTSRRLLGVAYLCLGRYAEAIALCPDTDRYQSMSANR